MQFSSLNAVDPDVFTLETGNSFPMVKSKERERVAFCTPPSPSPMPLCCGHHMEVEHPTHTPNIFLDILTTQEAKGYEEVYFLHNKDC